MDPTRSWQLLISLLPHLLALAEFYTGNDDEAVAAREEVDRNERCRDPFYANFYVELQTLEDNLESRDTSLDLPAKSINRVLELLECRCFALTVWENWQLWNTGTYRNLEKLFQQISAVRDKNTTLNDLIKKLRLRGLERTWRDAIIAQLTACNEELSPSGGFSRATQILPLVPTSRVRIEKLKRAKNAVLYSRKRRDLEERVHKVLIEQWHCSCKAKHAEAYLLLQPQSLSDENFDARYDIWFCGVSETPDHVQALMWQEADIFVCRSHRRNNHKDGYVVARSKDPSGKTTNLSTTKATNPSTISGREGPPWEVHKNICDLVNQAVKLTPRRLRFTIDNEVLRWDPHSPTYNSHQHEFVSLNKIIENSSSSVFTRETQLSRYLLSYLLASAFLRISGGPWCPDTWTKDQISFHRYPSNIINIRRPYLTTFLSVKTAAQQSIDRMRIQNRIHPYPQILGLGMLLLQIWLGKSIEAERSEDNPNRNCSPESYDIDADRTVAQKMLDRCRGNCLPSYIKAIEACLSTETFDAKQSFEDETFRENIYQEIISRLEETVLTYEVNVEDEQVLVTHPGIEENLATTSQLQQFKPPKAIAQAVDLPTSSTQLPNGSMNGRGTNAESNPDVWLERLNECVHPCLETKKTTAERALDPRTQIITRNGRVRVAILDTGLELPRHAVSTYKDRIMDFKDWVVGGKESSSWVDLDGHGTHSAGLILKVAPEAELYVARVFEKQGTGSDLKASKITKRNIAQAIRHAVFTWRVDIISMSFGFQENVEEINSAIREATEQRVLIFAAASNEGGNDGVAWPAKKREVFCIHAADGKGNKAPFTPSLLKNRENFTIPGINVQSVWPPHLQQGSRIRKTGTSCATPIGAGVAAIMLDIASIYLTTKRDISAEEDDIWRSLRSVEGMQMVFGRMSSLRDGYDYVVPWKFIGKRGLSIGGAMEVIFLGLRDEV